uniref:RBR-type E3 ubiquitin transferase n=1 Tax=Attheya septentrionalis TaxID=420275 RepID=A0A7S2UAP3_9STRA|mmetsp:Transcript_17681/g.31948  ORF Transcript_17681/g.31948 Transcript_17681/m.31948 type:complete len:516 (+) Transcript_17681:82-1629(+)
MVWWPPLRWWKGADEEGDGEETCPICIETFGWRNHHERMTMPCCNRRVCTNCLERHLKSIFEEVVTGAGRTALVCPLACGLAPHQLPDEVVRRVVRTQHFSLRHHILGTYLIHPLARVVRHTMSHVLSHPFWKHMSYAWILQRFLFSNNDHHNNHAPRRHDSQDLNQQYHSPTTGGQMTLIQMFGLTCATAVLWRFLACVEQRSRSHDWWYRIWWYGTHAPSERRLLAQYDRWSLTVAYRSIIGNSSGNDNNKCVVMHCPAPDCQYTWLASQSYHSQKQVHEKRHGTQSYSLMGRVSAKLFYSPLPPESSEPDNDSNHPNTTASLPWLTPQDVNLFDATRFTTLDEFNRHANQRGNHGNHNRAAVNRPEDNVSEDGRRMECAKCRAVFCGLCLRPWVGITSQINSGILYNGNNHRLVKHEGRPCRLVEEKWGKHSNDNDHVNNSAEDYVYAAQAVGAKTCPGCSMRILRIDGCNHMTCPCGTHWCYVCESKWRHDGHYACYIGQPSSSHSSCTIS